MTLVYRKLDVARSSVDLIAHGCNCRQTMGAGVAKYLSQLYPEIRRADRHFHPQGANDRLGLIDVIEVHTIPERSIRYVANCYTQRNIGHGLQVSYSAIAKCMQALHKTTLEKNLSVAMPKIGSDRGGGDWDTIANIIDRSFVNREVLICYL